MTLRHHRAGFLAVAILLAGCLGGGSSEDSSVSAPTPAPAPAQPNRAPTISGTPPASIRAGEAYDFRPAASDPDGDTLTFSVQNRPAWVSFDAATGRLHGTPAAADVGTYSNVLISVSDGRLTASLAGFSIAVTQVGAGSVTLRWTPPTTNADGTAITNLAGYKIYYSRSSANLDQVVTINNAGLTRYVIENLSPATYYFAMTSYNSLNVESSRSGTVSRTLN